MKVLVLEAGKDSADMDNMHMAGACVVNSLLLLQHLLIIVVQLDYEPQG